MKQNIHPEYREVAFVDLSINKTFIIRSAVQTKETVEIDGLCRVLDEYAEEVATLHLEEEVAALKEANESFKTKFEAKAEEEKAKAAK